MKFRMSLELLKQEIDRARQKFPDNRHLIDALAEELGEAARSPTPGKAGNPEWLQVACVAMRLYREGTPDDASPTLVLMEAAELIGRNQLDQIGRGT